MAGRRPIPTRLKLIKGTDQPCRIRKDEPTPGDDKIIMPKGLSVMAKAQWRRVIKPLKDTGIMTNIDIEALRLYCEAYALWADANDKIQMYGAVIKKNGVPSLSPYLTIANTAFDNMRKLLVEFGMTPASRTRVGSKKKEPEDEFAEL